VGLDPAALKELSAAARSVVDHDDAVGAELLVVKDHKTVLHEAFGFKDKESKAPMEPDTIFCIRSMTKPVAATAIQMLIDEGKIALSDRASQHLPAFRGTACEPITVEQLLTHRAGLPLSLINKPLTDYQGRADVVQQIAEQGPVLPIGGQFSYSDCGADSIGAIIDQVSGASAEEFIQHRILDPLGMRDTLTVVREGDPRRGRISNNYMGHRGDWTRYWSNIEPPIFPFLLTSQSLYSTPLDYARFVSLWLDGGVADGKRLLSPEAITRGLTSASGGVALPSEMTSTRLDYGQFWELSFNPSGEHELVAFGHGGSDGTAAWAFPKLNLIVCFFTQARLSTSPAEVEAVLDRRFAAPLVGKEPERPPPASEPRALDALLGVYWSADDGMYRAVSREDDKLMLEIPGVAYVELVPVATDQWAVRMARSQKLTFERDDQGVVVAINADTGSAQARLPRITETPGLPSVDELMKLHIAGHHAEKLDQLPPFRRTGTVDMPQRHLSGTIDSLVASPDRFRTQINLGASRQLGVLNGDRAWTANSGQPVKDLDPEATDQLGLDHPAALFGDLRPHYREIRVIAKTEDHGEPFYVLRAVPRHALPTAFIVNARTGLLAGQERLVRLPTLGVVGASVTYEDYRDVGGVQLPFRLSVEYATSLLGTTTIQFNAVDLSPEVPPHAFDRPEAVPAPMPEPHK
jgi:CubicO group peptidase (beta-lactamase class C family)